MTFKENLKNFITVKVSVKERYMSNRGKEKTKRATTLTTNKLKNDTHSLIK